MRVLVERNLNLFVKHGYEWKNIEVELDIKEKSIAGSGVAPGPFLRVQDARIQSTSAWWFEYIVGLAFIVMRPYKDNKDGGWSYDRKTIPAPYKTFSTEKWYHMKYRVYADGFVNDGYSGSSFKQANP